MVHLTFDYENTFCINMVNSIERWAKMQKKFNDFEMRVTRWNALTGPEFLDDKYASYLNKGQIGCAASHVSIWRHMIKKNIDYALILEDDACFHKEWLTTLSSFKESDFDAIFLNSLDTVEPLFTWVKCREQFGTAGYVIKKEGAQKLLNMFSDCFYASDWMTSRLQLDEKCYSYYPWLIIQEGGESLIGSNVDADHAKMLRLLSKINYSIENYNIDRKILSL